MAAVVVGLVPARLAAHPGSGIVVDRLGQVYFVDTGSGLWKIDTLGALTRIGTPRYHWLTLDWNDRFAHLRLPSGANGEIERVGSMPTLMLASDYPLAIGSDQNLYYPSPRPGRRSIDLLRLEPSGQRTVLATIALPYLNGIAAAADGSLYFTEDRAIRRVDPRGAVSTVLTGLGLDRCTRVPGNPADNPMLRGLAVDGSGVMYVAASGCGSVLRVSPTGEVATVYALDAPWSPTAVAVFQGSLFVLEYLHTEEEDRLRWVPRVRKVLPGGSSTIIASVTR